MHVKSYRDPHITKFTTYIEGEQCRKDVRKIKGIKHMKLDKANITKGK